MAIPAIFDNVGSVLVARLLDEFDPLRSDELLDELEQRIESGEKHVVIIFTPEMTVPSMLIGGLIHIAHKAREVSGNLVLTGVSQQYVRVMEISHLTQLLPVVKDLNAAITAAGKPGEKDAFGFRRTNS